MEALDSVLLFWTTLRLLFSGVPSLVTPFCTLMCGSGPWLRPQCGSLSRRVLLVCPRMCRVCRRLELSPDTEFKSFCLLCLFFDFPLTLASPGYSGLLLLFIFIPEKWPFRWIFTVSLLSHHDCAALGQSCQQNKQVNHREPVPCLSVAPSFASPLKLACPQSSSRDLSYHFLSLSSVFLYTGSASLAVLTGKL